MPVVDRVVDAKDFRQDSVFVSLAGELLKLLYYADDHLVNENDLKGRHREFTYARYFCHGAGIEILTKHFNV